MRLLHELAGDGSDGARAHAERRAGFRGRVQLPPGYHQYKFIVDGEWRHDENQAFIQDPLGNVNNWYAIPAILGPRRARASAASPPPARRRAAPRPAPRGSTKTLHPAPGWASEGVVFFPAYYPRNDPPRLFASSRPRVSDALSLLPARSPRVSPRSPLRLFVKKPGTSGEGAGGQAIPIPQPPQGGSGGGGDGGMDWIGSSMGQMQIKRDSEGQLKQPQQGSISAMGVKGVAGAVPGAEGAPDASRARVLEFLQRHTAYELIPESNKVVVLDTELPVRRAFHACFEQGIMAAPLWDERRREFVGMLSAGDFIDITQIVGSSLANTSVSEAELDAHTIAAVRAEQAAETGRAPAPLVSVRPEDSLHLVSLTLMQGRLALAPVLSYGAHVPRGANAERLRRGDGRSRKAGRGGETPQTGGSRADANDAASPSHRRDGGSSSSAGEGGGNARARPPAPQLLHLTNLAEVLATVSSGTSGGVRAALALLAARGALPLGTWTAALGGFRGSQRQPGGGGTRARASRARRDPPSRRGIRGDAGAAAPAHQGDPPEQHGRGRVPDDARVRRAPVVDEAGRLVDVYARADVILRTANNTYRRVALRPLQRRAGARGGAASPSGRRRRRSGGDARARRRGRGRRPPGRRRRTRGTRGCRARGRTRARARTR